MSRARQSGPPRYIGAFSVLLVIALNLLVAPAHPISLLNPKEVGQWSLPSLIPFGPVHAQVLPTGEVLLWRSSGQAGVWDPRTGAIEATRLPVEFGHEMNCSGHVVMADGRVLVVGGVSVAGGNSAGSAFFDPDTRLWQRGPDMHVGRWYPTIITEPSGSVLAVSGVASWDPPLIERLGADEEWHVVEGAEREMLPFPHLFVNSSGQMVRTGPESQSEIFDASRNVWLPGPSLSLPGIHASAPLGNSKRILSIAVTDGISPNSATSPATVATIFELEGELAWRRTTSMNSAFSDQLGVNLVALPDASVIAVGGGIQQNTPEIFEPTREEWTTMATAVHSRGHHSVAVLLPDGRILSSGGDDLDGPFSNPASIEIFSPPYLFRGERPVVEAAPSRMVYGSEHVVSSPDASEITSVSLVGLGGNTHSMNFGQRHVGLAFENSPGLIHLKAPLNGREAPPGWYMLFIVNGSGVPSVASIVQLS